MQHDSTASRRWRSLRWAVLVVVVLASACGDDADTAPTTPDGTDNAEVGTPIGGLNASIEAVGLSDTFEEPSYEELERCPLDPAGALLLLALSDLDAPDVEIAAQGELIAGIDWFAADEPPTIFCDRFPDDGVSGIGIQANEAPADVEAFARTFAARGSGSESLEVTYEQTGDHNGGSFHRVCVADPTDPDDIPYCEIDWVDAELMVGIYVAGPDALAIDLDVMEAGLQEILATVLDNLANAA